MTHWNIRTFTKKHYISTVWLDMNGHYETMIFAYKGKERKINWGGRDVHMAVDKERAVLNHCDAIWQTMKWESHAKNA